MDGMTPEVPEVGERLRVAERERDSLARRLSVRYEELERSRAEVESLTDQLGDMRAMVSAAEADRYQAYRAGRESAARDIKAWSRGEIETWPPPVTLRTVAEYAVRVARGEDS